MPRPRIKNRHLPPCIYHSHGAYYLVRNGRWQPLGKNLAVALAKYAAIHEPTKGTMSALIDEYLNGREGLSKSTQKHYKAAAKKLKEILVEFTPERVDSAHVVKIRRALSKKPGMANLCLTLLRQVFDYALEQQLVRNNPVVGVKRNRMKARDRLLTMSEFQSIREKSKPRLQVIMDLLYLTGQRIGDVLAIRRIDLVDSGIAFQQQKTGTKLVVRWTQELRDVVEEAKKLHGNVAALTLLHNRRGKAPDYNTVLSQWRAACALSGVQNARLHDLRAMAATASTNPKALLGHADEKTTKTYLRGKQVPIVEGPSFRRLIGVASQVSE